MRPDEESAAASFFKRIPIKLAARRFVRDLREKGRKGVEAYLKAMRPGALAAEPGHFSGSAAFFFFYRDALPVSVFRLSPGGARGLRLDLGHFHGQLHPQRNRRPAVRHPPSDQAFPAARPGRNQENPVFGPRACADHRLLRPGVFRSFRFPSFFRSSHCSSPGSSTTSGPSGPRTSLSSTRSRNRPTIPSDF